MSLSPADRKTLDRLQQDTFRYFWKEANPENGLVPDSSRAGSPSSIAAVGFALSCYPVGVERGFITRPQGLARTLTTLRFFARSAQGPQPDATGYRGFYYHFLDMRSGRRAGTSELSTIDSAILLAGVLTAGQYFGRASAEEREVRGLAEALSARAEWRWAQNAGAAVSHGWRPERGFIRYRWEGYNEGLLLYVLALGSPTHPLPQTSYRAWTTTYRWKKLYGQEHLWASPLFIHQLPHLWIDFRGIRDAVMRGKGIDYFQNSRRATYLQQRYAIRNPKGFLGYGRDAWGLTAGDGPGPARRLIGGRQRRFYAYTARGIPYGPDDGTLAPWAVVASLPFAPEIVLPAIRHVNQAYPEITSRYGFKCSFNPTFTSGGGPWIAQGYYGLDQGPVVLAIENHRSALLWRLIRRCPQIVRGLRRAGFTGGWLD